MLSVTPTCHTRVTTIRTTSSARPGKRYVTTRRTILGGLKPRHIIAIGESQSAGRLVTYIDAVHPLVHVYDGFLVHSRSGGAPIRDDVGVPVLVFQTETDVSFSNGTARQPDTSTYRLWEVAGTAHYDFYGLSIGPEDTGDGQGAVAMLASMQHPTSQPSPGSSTAAPRSTPGRLTTSSTRPSTGSTGGWPKASCRRSHLASKPPG